MNNQIFKSFIRQTAYYFFLSVVLVTFGCKPIQNSAETEIVSSTYMLMGTFVEIKIETTSDRVNQAHDAIKRAKADMLAMINIISSWDTKSDTFRINANAGKVPVKVDSRLMKILLHAQKVSKLSGGAFDITFSPIGQLWKSRTAEAVIPDEEQIAEALKYVDYTQIELNEQAATAFLRKAGMRIDLGGIAKGSVIDTAVTSLKKSGFENALINAGGDIYAMGTKAGAPWTIGIKNPRDKQGPIFGKINITNRAITTSGDYERMVVINGKRYHHIIDPRTGRPADKCISVTVVAADAETADAFSTAIFVLGPKLGIGLCEKVADVETVIITQDFDIIYSSGFPKITEIAKFAFNFLAKLVCLM